MLYKLLEIIYCSQSLDSIIDRAIRVALSPPHLGEIGLDTATSYDKTIYTDQSSLATEETSCKKNPTTL